MSNTVSAQHAAVETLPPVVVESLTHLRRYAGGGFRCRCEGNLVEVVEYVSRSDDVLALVDRLETALRESDGHLACRPAQQAPAARSAA